MTLRTFNSNAQKKLAYRTAYDFWCAKGFVKRSRAFRSGTALC